MKCGNAILISRNKQYYHVVTVLIRVYSRRYNNLHYNILNFLRSINHLVHHSVVFLLSYLLINIPRLPSFYQHGATWSAHIL